MRACAAGFQEFENPAGLVQRRVGLVVPGKVIVQEVPGEERGVGIQTSQFDSGGEGDDADSRCVAGPGRTENGVRSGRMEGFRWLKGRGMTMLWMNRVKKPNWRGGGTLKSGYSVREQRCAGWVGGRGAYC